ncbi:MAG: D-alanyl-D-alanine carboxypeptidase [Lachnospiraceae bacterium]|nr:D-alanyl-D-alanine carboxypeptidase [Lachnospiraceae bacterium]
MKSISNRFNMLLLIVICTSILSGCAGSRFSYPYDAAAASDNLRPSDVFPAFTEDFAVAGAQDIALDGLSFDDRTSAGLFAAGSRRTLYAKDLHTRRDPASLTKVMTAIVALKYGSLDQVLTSSTDEYIDDPEAQMLTMQAGEQMTLNQALHFLLVFSANDVAMMIAEAISGDVPHFVALMNEEALRLGATNTHFANPHGLTEDGQYTTAYDMYLIFQEAVKSDVFCQIISMPSYKTQYYRNDGTLKEVEVRSTNALIRENSTYVPPAGVTVVGGKTGSTDEAGQCLILLFKDSGGVPYIAVYMHAADIQALYDGMGALMLAALRNGIN